MIGLLSYWTSDDSRISGAFFLSQPGSPFLVCIFYLGRAFKEVGKEKWVEAPGGFEPPHRSFAVRPTTLLPMMIQNDRVRRRSNEIIGFSQLSCDQL